MSGCGNLTCDPLVEEDCSYLALAIMLPLGALKTGARFVEVNDIFILSVL